MRNRVTGGPSISQGEAKKKEKEKGKGKKGHRGTEQPGKPSVLVIVTPNGQSMIAAPPNGLEQSVTPSRELAGGGRSQ